MSKQKRTDLERKSWVLGFASDFSSPTCFAGDINDWLSLGHGCIQHVYIVEVRVIFKCKVHGSLKEKFCLLALVSSGFGPSLTSKSHPVDSRWQIATSMSSIAVICCIENKPRKWNFSALSFNFQELAATLPESLPRFAHGPPSYRSLFYSQPTFLTIQSTLLRFKTKFRASWLENLFKLQEWMSRFRITWTFG